MIIVCGKPVSLVSLVRLYWVSQIKVQKCQESQPPSQCCDLDEWDDFYRCLRMISWYVMDVHGFLWFLNKFIEFHEFCYIFYGFSCIFPRPSCGKWRRPWRMPCNVPSFASWNEQSWAWRQRAPWGHWVRWLPPWPKPVVVWWLQLKRLRWHWQGLRQIQHLGWVEDKSRFLVEHGINVMELNNIYYILFWCQVIDNLCFVDAKCVHARFLSHLTQWNEGGICPRSLQHLQLLQLQLMLRGQD